MHCILKNATFLHQLAENNLIANWEFEIMGCPKMNTAEIVQPLCAGLVDPVRPRRCGLMDLSTYLTLQRFEQPRVIIINNELHQ